MRLTKKNDGTGSWTQFGDKYLPAHNIKHKKCVNKLGQLEDIEEELGVDLITLFKALKNGIYAKVYIPMSFGIKDIQFLDVEKTGLGLYKNFIRTNCGMYQLKDYGKTWALTREELENDK